MGQVIAFRKIAVLSIVVLAVTAHAQYIPAGGGSGGGGTVTSVATGCGTSGGPVTGSGTIIRSEAVNAQTGTTYVVLTTDCGKLVTHTNSAAIAVTLPQAGVSFPAGWFYDEQNRGAGTVTITPATSTIDGAASLDLLTGQGVRIVSDGTNYFTQRGTGLMAGSGTIAGEYKMYELAANGGNFVSWVSPDSRATDARFLFPTADPTAGQMMAFGAPDGTSKKATGTWALPLVSGATTAFTFNGGGSLGPGGGVVTANFWQNFGTCYATGASPLACGAANGGAVTIAAGATSVVVTNALIGLNSQVVPIFESSTALATSLGIATCNTTAALPWISDRVNGVSFTISVAVAPVANPACIRFVLL